MDRAPLPPHERPWRHPSELGPPEHEPTTAGGRALIVTTATLSLLLIGLLALTMTPDRAAAPETAGSAASAARGTPVTVASLERPALPIVTPVGDDGLAITTMGAVAGRADRLSARLPSGEVVEVEIVSSNHASGLTVVSLPPSATAESYELAGSTPAPSDTVLVNGQPPQVVTMLEIADLDVDEGTPVLDDDGDLVGICTEGDDGVAVRTIATMPDDPTPATTDHPATTPSTTPATTTTSTTSTTAPSTTLAPTATSVATTAGATGGAPPTTPGSTVSGGGVATTAPR